MAQSAPASSGSGKSIALNEVIQTAVKQNRALRAADADIVIAEANEWSATGNEDFLLDGSVSVNARRVTPVIVEGVNFVLTRSDTAHAEFGVTKPLFYGGRVGLRASHDYSASTTRQEFSGTSEDQERTEHNPSLQLTYFMPLLRDFGEKNMRSARIRAAASTDVAMLERENNVANVVQSVVLAYWELAYAAQDVEIRKSSLDLAREQLRITQARLDVGVGSPTDVAAVRQGIATRESDVLVAQLALSERALDLRQLAGMDISPADLEMVAADRLEPKVGQVDYEASLKGAWDHNPQIATLRARGKQATIEVEMSENGLLPQLDLNASFGPQGSAEAFGASYENLAKFKDYSVFASLTFSTPIGRNAARGAQAAARGQLLKVRVNEDDLKAQITVAVLKAVNLLRSTEKRMQADSEAVQLGQVNLDAEKARFDVGRTTNFEVLKRQDELAQSRLRLTRTAADYMKAVAGLSTLTGELLPQYGIVVKNVRDAR